MQHPIHRTYSDIDDVSSYTPMNRAPDSGTVSPLLAAGSGFQSSTSSHRGWSSRIADSSSFDERSLRSSSDVGSFGGDSSDQWSTLSRDEPTMPAYYHPQISEMNEVFEIMGQYSEQEGFFLVRNSFTKPGTLTISVIHDGGVKHFSIVSKEGLFSVVDTKFSSLHELVVFYRHNDVPNLERIKNIRLKFPINVLTSARRSISPSPVMVGRLPDAGPHSTDTFSQPVLIGGDSSYPAEGLRRVSQGEPQNGGSRRSSDHHRLSLGEKFRRLFRPRKSSGTSRDDSTDPELPIRPVRAPSSSSRAISTDAISIKPALSPRDSSALIDASMIDEHQSSPTDRGTPNSESGSSLSATALHIANKPAAPLPTDADELVPPQSPSGGSAYYSSPRDIECKLSELLIAKMQHEEKCLSESGAGRCECGLNLDEAELPRGWSLHLSTDPETEGRVFFTGPDGRCSWNLPIEVSIELDPEQQDRIRLLLDANEKKAASRRRKRAQAATVTTVSRQQPPSAEASYARCKIVGENEASQDSDLQRFSNDGVDSTSELNPVTGLRRLARNNVIADPLLAASLEPSSSLQSDSRHSVASRQEFFV